MVTSQSVAHSVAAKDHIGVGVRGGGRGRGGSLLRGGWIGARIASAFSGLRAWCLVILLGR